MDNGKILEFLKQQRIEDKEIEEKRHIEVLQKIETNSIDVEIAFKKHTKYHEDNEHKWGVFKWLNNHKKIVFFVGMFLGAVIVICGLYLGYNWKDILSVIIKKASG